MEVPATAGCAPSRGCRVGLRSLGGGFRSWLAVRYTCAAALNLTSPPSCVLLRRDVPRRVGGQSGLRRLLLRGDRSCGGPAGRWPHTRSGLGRCTTRRAPVVRGAEGRLPAPLPGAPPWGRRP